MAKVTFKVMTPQDGHKTIEFEGTTQDATKKFDELLAASPGAQAYKVAFDGVKKVAEPITGLTGISESEEILIRPAMQGGC